MKFNKTFSCYTVRELLNTKFITTFSFLMRRKRIYLAPVARQQRAFGVSLTNVRQEDLCFE